jgi:hypothetical protein
MGVSKEPSIDVRLFLPRDLLEVFYKIAGILSVTAINGDHLAALGGNDVALHLNACLCLQKVD